MKVKKIMATAGLAVLLFAICQKEIQKGVSVNQQGTSQQSDYLLGSYAISDDYKWGGYVISRDMTPKVVFKTLEGDTLESLAELLYGDKKYIMHVDMAKLSESLLPEDVDYRTNPLPKGIRIKAYMNERSIERFSKDFSSREIKVIK